MSSKKILAQGHGRIPVETEGGRARPEREKTVALHPNSEDFLVLRHLDPETLEKYREFSDPAKAAFRQLMIDHGTKLIHASSSAKRIVDGDNVSEANVVEASYDLSRREGTGLKKLAGVVGGALLGTGFSTLESVLEVRQFDRDRILLIAFAGFFGALLVALDLPSLLPRWRKRKYSTPPKPVKVKRRTASQVQKGREPKA